MCFKTQPNPNFSSLMKDANTLYRVKGEPSLSSLSKITHKHCSFYPVKFAALSLGRICSVSFRGRRKDKTTCRAVLFVAVMDYVFRERVRGQNICVCPAGKQDGESRVWCLS